MPVKALNLDNNVSHLKIMAVSHTQFGNFGTSSAFGSLGLFLQKEHVNNHLFPQPFWMFPQLKRTEMEQNQKHSRTRYSVTKPKLL